jgi:imidazole glycerol phosphate synthase glutamine amidotransferase subunit
MTRVAIIDTGVANLASVRRAFERLGATVAMLRAPRSLGSDEHLVLPGVGAFGAGMATLRASGLDRVVLDAVDTGRPTLAICLGMQLLLDASDESPGVPGLGVISGVCRRLPRGARVPHLGWNWVEAPTAARWITSGYAAFANSYALTAPPDGMEASWTLHGEAFVAGLEHGPVVACQFHPELSGSWGQDLLRRWLEQVPRPLATRTVRPAPGLARRIIPCLDVCAGRVVKGVRFQGLRDAGDPAALAAEYQSQGADELVLLDVAAAPQGRATQVEIVRQVRTVLAIPLTVGGGVRGVEDARRLLDAGADKVSVNTAAVARPELLRQLAAEFGRQCVVLAIDARRAGGRWEPVTLSGRERTGLDVVEWAAQGTSLGAGEILLTSWDRDGTRRGADLDLLEAVRPAVHVPVIASGGIGSVHDAARAFRAGADAVLAASILHDHDTTVTDLKRGLTARGIAVRV